MKWWAARKYRDAVDEWLAECEAREALLSRATKAARGIYTDNEFRPERDERLVDAFDSELLAMRRVRVTNYGSASHRTASHNTYRVGQARSESHDELRSIDRGRVIVTDRRIVHLGRRTEEVRWHRMLNLTDDERRGVITFTVGNRKTPVMIRVPRTQRRELGFAVRVALDLHDGNEERLVDNLEASLAAIRNRPPEVPDGVAPDPRAIPAPAPAPPLALPGKPRELPAAAAATPPESADMTRLPVGQFVHTPAQRVAVATGTLGLRVTIAQWVGNIGPTVTELPALPSTRPDSVTVLIAAGPEQLVAGWLHQTRPEVSIVVDDTRIDWLTVLDEDTGPEITLVSPDELEAVESDRRASANVMTLTVTSDQSGMIELVGDRARVARALNRKQTYVLIVSGPSELVEPFTHVVGFHEVVIAATDTETDDIPESDDAPAVVASTPTIVVAGVPRPEPARIIADYLTEHARTFRIYDQPAGTWAEVSPELIAATRVLSSRISKVEEEWFIDRAKTAPWESVPHDSALADADPCEVSGLYDHASNLYAHFRDAAPSGVAAAKVYKVLHLMRPNVFPILDSRLQRVYDKAARAAAVVVNGCRPDLPDSKWAYWAAIRIDITENRSQIEAVRQALGASANPFIADASRALSDLRLLDILTWVGANEVS